MQASRKDCLKQSRSLSLSTMRAAQTTVMTTSASEVTATAKFEWPALTAHDRGRLQKNVLYDTTSVYIPCFTTRLGAAHCRSMKGVALPFTDASVPAPVHDGLFE